MIKDLTIIVPVYNEESNIKEFYDSIKQVLCDTTLNNWNILFVDDGSTDNTLNEIKGLNQSDSKIKYLSFSKNFGKEAAIYAGIENAYSKFNSSHYILMDVDFQDPPQLIPEMIDKMISDNCECVCTRKTNRKGDPKIRSFFSNVFYKIINKVSKINLKSGTRDFRLMSSKYVKAVLACKEYNRFFKGISNWIGFEVSWIEYPNVARHNGKSRISIIWLFKYAMDAAVAYSTWPLTVISAIGLILSLVSFIFLIYVFIKAIFCGDPVAGWPSLACLILFLGSLILISIGFLGLYFEKMYLEVKDRPKYLLDESNL